MNMKQKHNLLLDTYNSVFTDGDDIYYFDIVKDEVIEQKWDKNKKYDFSFRYYKDHDDITHDLTYHFDLFTTDE